MLRFDSRIEEYLERDGVKDMSFNDFVEEVVGLEECLEDQFEHAKGLLERAEAAEKKLQDLEKSIVAENLRKAQKTYSASMFPKGMKQHRQLIDSTERINICSEFLEAINETS